MGTSLIIWFKRKDEKECSIVGKGKVTSAYQKYQFANRTKNRRISGDTKERLFIATQPGEIFIQGMMACGSF